MKKYLITGGAGFIGSNTTERIIQNGDHVTIIDNLTTGFIENLQPFLDNHPNQIKFINGTIEDLDLLQKEFKGIDYVIHLAAYTSVQRSVENPLDANKINIDALLNVLIAARDNKVKRVVFASTAAVYGNSPKQPKDENITPEPLSPYAVGKITGEYYMKIFYQLYGLETVCLRYFNIFGTRQNPNSPYSLALPKFIKTMIQGESPVIFGDGKQARDFTYVANLVQANLLACESKRAVGESINIACGKLTTVLEMVEAINKALGTDIKPTFTPPRAGEVRMSYADISKAKNLLGYKPEVEFEDGIKKAVEWHKERIS